MPCPAVSQIVAVDRGHDDMGKPKLGDRVSDALGLVLVERARQSGAHVAEGAGARAGVPHDHEGGVALVPALADVGTARLLADGCKLEFAHEAHRLGEHRRTGGAHADPGRLAGDRLVRPVRLLGVAQAQARSRFGQVDEPGHGSLSRIGSLDGQTSRPEWRFPEPHRRGSNTQMGAYKRV